MQIGLSCSLMQVIGCSNTRVSVKHPMGTFEAEIMLSSDKTDQTGFVVDFVELKDKMGKWISENRRHAFLVNGQDDELLHAPNSLEDKKIFVFHNENPTAEVMAKYLYSYVRKLYGDLVSEVRIWESPTQYGDYFEGYK